MSKNGSVRFQRWGLYTFSNGRTCQQCPVVVHSSAHASPQHAVWWGARATLVFRIICNPQQLPSGSGFTCVLTTGQQMTLFRSRGGLLNHSACTMGTVTNAPSTGTSSSKKSRTRPTSCPSPLRIMTRLSHDDLFNSTLPLQKERSPRVALSPRRLFGTSCTTPCTCHSPTRRASEQPNYANPATCCG